MFVVYYKTCPFVSFTAVTSDAVFFLLVIFIYFLIFISLDLQVNSHLFS